MKFIGTGTVLKLKGGPKVSTPLSVNGLFSLQTYIQLIDQIMWFCRGEDGLSSYDEKFQNAPV